MGVRHKPITKIARRGAIALIPTALLAGVALGSQMTGDTIVTA